jgi:hypothetical protein
LFPGTLLPLLLLLFFFCCFSVLLVCLLFVYIVLMLDVIAQHSKDWMCSALAQHLLNCVLLGLDSLARRGDGTTAAHQVPDYLIGKKQDLDEMQDWATQQH